MARAMHFGKIYRFMGMNGIIPSLENSTMLYRNPRRFNDPLDVSWSTRNITPIIDQSIRQHGLKVAFDIYIKKLKNRDENRNLTDLEVESILKEDVGIPSDVTLEDLSKVPLSNSLINELTNLLKQAFPKDQINEERLRVDVPIKICCFSRAYDTPKSFLMWSHYSDSHRGACLEFDTRKLFDNMAGLDRGILLNDNPIAYTFPFKVRYVRKLPKFNGHEDNDFFKWMITKSKIWKYEDEVRMFYAANNENADIVSNENEIILPFPFEYLTKIIFGNLVGADQITLIRDIVTKKYPGNIIQFEKMEINPNKFNLFAKKLE